MYVNGKIFKIFKPEFGIPYFVPINLLLVTAGSQFLLVLKNEYFKYIFLHLNSWLKSITHTHS